MTSETMSAKEETTTTKIMAVTIIITVAVVKPANAVTAGVAKRSATGRGSSSRLILPPNEVRCSTT